MRKRYMSPDSGKVTRWYSKSDLEAGTEMAGDQVAKALWDLNRAESRGFHGCWAVFCDFRYDGLDEAISEQSRKNGGGWGRGQDVTYRNTVGSDGKLIRDNTYPVAPAEWVGEFNGYICEIRTNFQAARCGYVTVPKGHPAHGKGYDSLEISVHGGLTYARESEDGGWKFGFDCSHSGDAGHPEYQHGEDYRRIAEGEYRSREYVLGEIKDLAEQLKVMEKKAADGLPPKG